MTRTLSLLAVALVGLLALSGARAEDLLLRGGHVWPVAGEALAPGDVLIREGRIAAIGVGIVPPEGARIIDVTGKHLCPGFLDARSHLGLARHESDETVAPFGSELSLAGAAFWPERDEVKRALASGVTTCLLTPGTANPLAGRCALAKLGRPFPTTLPEVLQISLTQSALLWYREPTSWPGMLRALREKLRAAPTEMPVQIVCDGPVEAQQAVALARELGLRASLFVARPSVRLPDSLRGSGLTVALPVLLTTPLDAAQRLPAALAANGLRLAFGSEAPYNDPSDLRACAALAVAGGLPEAEALRALTLSPAEALGVADRLGSLEVGKDADLLVLGGEPLNLQAPIEMVIADGVVVHERGQRP